jgi:3-oxoacyl-[acyl-carrier-protein] synthase-1
MPPRPRPAAPAEILGVGVFSPVGATAAQTAASLRAGISRTRSSPHFDRFGQALVMGFFDQDVLPGPCHELVLSGLGPRGKRLVQLAAPALGEALAGIPSPVPLLLGLPEPTEAAPEALGVQWVELLAEQSGCALDGGRSVPYFAGRAAGLLALEGALELVGGGGAELVVAGGVDSYFLGALIRALDQEGRLHTGELPDGFIPGEAAAFLLVGAPGAGRRLGRTPLARIAGIGTGREPGHLYSAEPYRGAGLAEAFAALFAAAPVTETVATVYAGLNGESFWAKEWGVAQIRSSARFSGSMRLEHPVDAMGDPGAALGPLMVAVAALGLSRGKLAGPCLVWCSSDREQRAAALLTV